MLSIVSLNSKLKFFLNLELSIEKLYDLVCNLEFVMFEILFPMSITGNPVHLLTEAEISSAVLLKEARL